MALWHFNHKMNDKEEVSVMKDLPLEDAFEFYCEGLTPFGPYWDHLLGYWRASLESRFTREYTIFKVRRFEE